MEFSLACARAGVQPIIGCKMRVSPADSPARAAERRPRPDDLIVLVQNETGYRNLLRLSSRAFLETESGELQQVGLAELEAHSDGLIALTGGPGGTVGRLLAQGQAEAAEAMLARLAAIFHDRLYVELMRHGLDGEGRIEAELVDLAYRHDLPLVATNEVYFADEGMFEAHDVLLGIADGKHISERDRRRLTPEHRFKSAAEMRTLFADLPEAADNTLVIARRCAFMVPVREPILPRFLDTEGRSEAEVLREAASAGLERRLEARVVDPGMDAAQREAAGKAYWERLEYELGVIIEMNYPGYFLIVADFIQWAKRQGIPVGPGRGSGAGSVVAWALTITDLDPLRFGLLFERFLNPERVSMPDFDIDFCQERRDEVIEYVRDKYGADRVAQIITFGTLQARAALRDVGRVLGMPYGQVDRICKLIPNNPAAPVSLAEAIEREPLLQRMREEDTAVERLLDIALKLEGLYRHASTHAAGIVIADRPLEQLVPLYRDPRSNMHVTQFSMKYVELAGLVKLDFLGLKTLTILDHARRLLAERGVNLDLDTLPLDDAPTFEMLGRGETVGVFQLESAGMRDVLRRLQPDAFDSIIALVALYRPGPMENIPRYIACKRGEEIPDYLHDSLKDILKETFGVIIYQEQVMRIAQVLASYSLGSADLLRYAMGKKNKAVMDAQRETFVTGAVDNHVDRARAAHIFDIVAKFAGYGFNKSHATAYALVAYQTAYLKANHPVEFLAASMSFELGNTDKINLFRQEIDRLGVGLLPPDINRSGVTFTVEREGTDRSAIRYSLAALKNVGAQAVRAIVDERDANGPYGDLWDFASRLDPRVANKRQLESLACAGAFDCLDVNRAEAYQAVERVIRMAGVAASERESQQANLFGGVGAPPPPGQPAPPETPDWPPLERLAYEYDAIGFYLSAHPLDAYGTGLDPLNIVPSTDLAARVAQGRSQVKVAGVVIAKQERASSGGRYAFVRLSDPSGTYEIAVFREVLSGARDLLDSGKALLITASARLEGGSVKLTAQSIEDLDKVIGARRVILKVVLRDAEPLDRLRGLLAEEGRGRGRISLIVRPDRVEEVEIDLPGQYALSPALRAAVEDLPGVLAVTQA